MGYVKVVIGVLSAGKGIRAPGMLTQELTILVLFGVLLSSQKQHMLTEMSQSGNI